MLAAKLVEGRMLAMARASRNLIMFFRGFFMVFFMVFFWGFSGVFLGLVSRDFMDGALMDAGC
jgi:hypothetical protein